MTNAEIIKEAFNYGTPFVILAVVIWGLYKTGKWASELINEAILHPKHGWRAAVNRTATATENYLEDTAKRDEMQQQLCEEHAKHLQDIGSVLRGHLEVSNATLEGLEQFRKDAVDPVAPFSTVETNQRLKNIQAAICEACEATKEIVKKTSPEVATDVAIYCDKIKTLVRNGK